MTAMGLDPELARALRAAQFKLTPQRMLIINALRAIGGHATAAQVHEHVRRDYPHLDVSTVYRTLTTLVEGEFVNAFLAGTEERTFEWREGPAHHHLICQGCGWTAPVPPEALDTLMRGLQSGYRFTPDLNHLAIPGLCEGCAAGKG